MAGSNIALDDASLLASKLLDLTTERQTVISNNMANAETPGYIRQDLDFQKKLKEIVEGGDLSQLSDLKGKLVEDNSEAPRMDGNNVSIASEMNQLMQNGVFFNLLARAYSTRMNIIRESMRGG